MSGVHHTVLLPEAVSALVTTPTGVYVDGTFGRGGHSAALLEQLEGNAKLLAIDKDPTAESVAKDLFANDSRFSFFHGSFADLPACLKEMGITRVDGILLDLGVSSPQLDDGRRGFSFSHDGPLDMRMDTSRGCTAAQWLELADETEIARVLRDYGEERFARRIAAAIVNARQEAPLQTTAQLARVVSDANPRWEKHKHPATRTFQAIRIQVNSELEDLQQLLNVSLDLLLKGGRLVVISFHSLEDRMVKRFMRDRARGEELPPGVPVRDVALNRQLKIIGKAVRPGQQEIDDNPRARSAVMRVGEKL